MPWLGAPKFKILFIFIKVSKYRQFNKCTYEKNPMKIFI
jgi:hypothetical protein